jgi:hypothetical protein
MGGYRSAVRPGTDNRQHKKQFPNKQMILFEIRGFHTRRAKAKRNGKMTHRPRGAAIRIRLTRKTGYTSRNHIYNHNHNQNHKSVVAASVLSRKSSQPIRQNPQR